MSHSFSDPRANQILNVIRDVIVDRESNETILMSISRFFSGGRNRSTAVGSPDFSPLINDRQFVYQLFFQFFGESIMKDPISGVLVVNELQLSQRSKVLSKFVYQYREFQLSLLVVLTEIKVALSLGDAIFDDVLKILHQNGVISDDAFNHWFQCKGESDRRLKSVQNCLRMLKWSQEAREDYFFETNGILNVTH